LSAAPTNYDQRRAPASGSIANKKTGKIGGRNCQYIEIKEEISH
jgi:hypothetical protein